jgi:hypothetical protein
MLHCKYQFELAWGGKPFLTMEGMMAFSDVGPFFLARSAGSLQYEIYFDYIDKGAIYMMANPETDEGYVPQRGSAVFAVGNFVKTRTYSGDTGEWYYTYNVNVQNVGDMDTWFSLEGGGCT